MRTSRFLGAAFAAALLSAPLAGTAGAADAVQGTGTGTVSSSVLELTVGGGDLLSVRVLGTDTTSTIAGARSASSTVVPLTVSSAAAGIDVALAELATASTGAEDAKSQELAVPAELAGFAGSLGAALSSVVDDAGARSGADAGITGLVLAGGLVSLPSGTLAIDTDAASGRSLSTHTLTIPSATVLDLSALLEGLGLELPDLSIDALLDLLDSLGVPLDGVADPRALVEELNGAVALLEGATGTDTVTAELCASVDEVLGGAIGTVGGVVGGVADAVGGTGGGLLSAAALEDGVTCDDLVGLDVDAVLQDVEDTLGELLDGILRTLDGTALLSVEDVAIGLSSTATDKVETSVADVTASIGAVKVGALPVPGVSGLDLTAPADVVNQAAAAIQAQVNGVLATLNAELANLVDVDVLAIEELVSGTATGVEALSRVTALRATITPPASLLSAAAVDVEDSIGAAIAVLGGALPALDPLMGALEGALGGLDVLTAPTVLTVGTVSATSAFQPVVAQVAAPTGAPTGSLPRTGTDAALPAMAATALAGAALAIRRLLRTAAI